MTLTAYLQGWQNLPISANSCVRSRITCRQWFEQDKSQHLDREMNATLRRIVDEVIGKKLSKSFLVPRDLERHPMILKLFDARVIHHLQRGYADKASQPYFVLL